MGRYSYTTGNRFFMFLVFAALLVGGVFGVVASLTRPDGPSLLFMALWIGALGWNAYWWLWRISYRLEVDGDRLRWMTPLRNGEVLVSDVQAIRSGWLNQLAVIEVRDNADITSLSRSGISEFASALAGDRAIPVNTMVPLGERLIGSRASAFQRES
jgi:hypothetical protein